MPKRKSAVQIEEMMQEEEEVLESGIVISSSYLPSELLLGQTTLNIPCRLGVFADQILCAGWSCKNAHVEALINDDRLSNLLFSKTLPVANCYFNQEGFLVLLQDIERGEELILKRAKNLKSWEEVLEAIVFWAASELKLSSANAKKRKTLLTMDAPSRLWFNMYPEYSGKNLREHAQFDKIGSQITKTNRKMGEPLISARKSEWYINPNYKFKDPYWQRNDARYYEQVMRQCYDRQDISASESSLNLCLASASEDIVSFLDLYHDQPF